MSIIFGRSLYTLLRALVKHQAIETQERSIPDMSEGYIDHEGLIGRPESSDDGDIEDNTLVIQQITDLIEWRPESLRNAFMSKETPFERFATPIAIFTLILL